MGDASHIPGHHGDGMVIDFHDLKTLVKTHITDRFDHALMINRLIPENRVNALKSTTDRLFIVDFQPTTENLVGYIAGILKPLMPQGVSLFSIRLFETVTSFAEWYATDNN